MSLPKSPGGARFPHWEPHYEAVLNETNKTALKHRLTALETAIFNRMQEIAGRSDCEEERLAMETAVARMREIQREKLGFPDLSMNPHERTH